MVRVLSRWFTFVLFLTFILEVFLLFGIVCIWRIVGVQVVVIQSEVHFDVNPVVVIINLV